VIREWDMTFYAGSFYRQDQVSIGPPDLRLLSVVTIDSDVRYAVEHWVSEAQEQEDILYFSIFLDQELIGQILLHDMNIHTGESLIAYHLFRSELRGQGFGKKALRLLQSYTLSHTSLKELVIITSCDNLASQSVARKCGFQYDGGSREDPVNNMVFEWHVPRNSH
jgi:RimJ/RimL family protein N-acetyltransferase